MRIKNSRHLLWTAVLAGTLLVGSFHVGFADSGNPGDYIHSRTYVGVVVTSVSVSNNGLFSGNNYSAIQTPQYEIDLIPALAQNFGYGILLGHREEAYALEISFWQSNHTASFGGTVLAGPGSTVSSVDIKPTVYETAVYNSVNLTFKRYFLTEMNFQPFIGVGVSFPWILVPNASYGYNQETNQAQIGQLTLAGLGLDLGIGAEYYLNPNISLVGGAYERWASFNQTNGFTPQFEQIAEPYNSSNSSDGSGLIFELGTTFGFQ